MTAPQQRKDHWEQVYRTKADEETSWFQNEPADSLALIRSVARTGGRVIDIGGGSSALAGALVDEGFDVTVLDVSQAAIERARLRAGDRAGRIRWIVSDVTEAEAVGAFDIWHDRAAFHFLTDEADRRKYIALGERSVTLGGHAIIGTFAMSGPEQCSGLPVRRYDEVGITAAFGPGFAVVATREAIHMTPWGKPQAFFFAVLRRVGEAE